MFLDMFREPGFRTASVLWAVPIRASTLRDRNNKCARIENASGRGYPFRAARALDLRCYDLYTGHIDDM